jgi:hypothetical protein
MELFERCLQLDNERRQSTEFCLVSKEDSKHSQVYLSHLSAREPYARLLARAVLRGG